MMKPITVVNKVRFLAPAWHQACALVLGKNETTMNRLENASSPRRAGRTLTREDYEQLENVRNILGGQSNGRIQRGLLGGIGGVRIFGESPG